MAIRICPICDSPVAPRRENPAAPFCSRRCQLLDLGKWLDSDYKITSTVTDRNIDPGDVEIKH